MTERLPEVIRAMLHEIGIVDSDEPYHDCLEHICLVNADYRCSQCKKSITIPVEQRICCGELVTYYSHGYYTCWHCAKQWYDPPMIWYNGMDNNEDGAQPAYKRRNDGVVWTKRRYYSKRLQFRTLLNQYIGNVMQPELDDDWVEHVQRHIDVHKPDAYIQIRDYLRRTKQAKLYGKIYCCIYLLGGQRPQLTPAQSQQLRVEFDAIEDYFTHRYQPAGQRSSMYSVPSLLELLLRDLGHTPFYQMYQLKDRKLLNLVKTFYASYRAHALYYSDHNISSLAWLRGQETVPNQTDTLDTFADVHRPSSTCS
jgi:hypothetical protein